MVINKKRFAFLFIFLSLFSIGAVSAGKFGVSPAWYDVNFEPGLQKEYFFTFYSDNPSLNLEVYKTGDLSEYVSFTPETLEGGGGQVKVMVALPQNIEKPGQNQILIGTRQIEDESGGVGFTASVLGAIRVHVPYPGKYLESLFTVTDSNSGEPARYHFELFSRGDESVTVTSRIDVYNSEEAFVTSFEAGTHTIAAGESKKLIGDFGTSELGPGNYRAVLVSVYEGGEVTSGDFFKLGELNVGIVNYTSVLASDSINPFFVEVESFWNDPIDTIYADLRILETNQTSRMPSTSLAPWSKQRLEHFIDTSGIEQESITLEITLHFDDEVNQKVVEIPLVNESNGVFRVLFVSFFVLMFFTGIGLLIYLLIKRINRARGQL